MSHALIYTTLVCPYCVAAKNFLKQKGYSFDEVRVDLDPLRRQEMRERSRRTSVPQIFFGNVHVGGFDDLVALERRGELGSVAGLAGNQSGEWMARSRTEPGP